ncbi:MAG: VOC family protein [Bacillota bacterium]
MPVSGYSSIWYPVAAWEAAKRFYSEGLGLPLLQVSDEDGWALLAVPGGGPPFFLVRKPARAGGSGGPVLGLTVTDLPALLEQVVACGGRVDPLVQEGSGVRITTIYDPDGNLLELTEAP